MLIDTHCHLTFPPLCDDLPGVLQRAAQRGVTRIVCPAYDVASFERVLALKNIDGIYSAYGLHPWAAEEALDEGALLRRLIEGRAIAVGEIGLDFKTSVSRDRQVDIFKVQLLLALEMDLPVLLHVRGAFEEMLGILGRMSPRPRGVVHAFSKGPELARRFFELGYDIAFGGAITRPNAKQARRAAATLPAEHMLLETDAPAIGLEGIIPERVEPGHVADIAAAAAALRGTSTEQVAACTTENANRLFRFPK